MKPLICPQCGGKITEYDEWQKFATCKYCSTRFLIEQAPQPEPVRFEMPAPTVNFNFGVVSMIVGALVFFFIAVVAFSLIKSKPNRTPPTYPVYTSTPTVKSPTPAPTATPNPNLLEFGGKGTGNGLFKDAGSIAVDKRGRIYVSDDSLRVQQFNERGEFLKVWQIPSEGKNYKRAKTIQKIAVDDQDRLYVLVGGVVQRWSQEMDDVPEVTFHAAPDFIVDFALRADGGLLMVSLDDDIETLIFMNGKEKVTRRLRGFHTETADASLSPFETGLAAIRLATDGAGNIYSIYAFGDLGSYQLSYSTEELVIFRFTPEGKYVNKFVETMNSCGIALDNQSRLYITDDDAVKIYSNAGESLSTVEGFTNIDAFALDAANNMYVLSDDRVVKRAAIQ